MCSTVGETVRGFSHSTHPSKDYSVQTRIVAEPEPYPTRARRNLNSVRRPENGGWVTEVGAGASANYPKGASYDNNSVGRSSLIL